MRLSMALQRLILTLSCTDQPGIVGAVGTCLAENRCNIVESAQFGDVDTGRFMMRVSFDRLAGAPDASALTAAFEPIATRFGMQWALHDAHVPPRVLLLVSKFDHCLNDLLYRHKVGALAMTPVAVASNHRDCEALTASYGIAFHYLPRTPATRDEQEGRIAALFDDTRAELVVLARYMQILTEDFLEKAPPVINIHHGFLPAFQGARPYHQAHARGVKLVGATAHYATKDLDQGPIIEQDVARVTHAMGPDDMARVGRDVERLVLSRAVRAHLERRVIVEGRRTVVL